MYREAEGDSECCLVTRGPGPRSRGWAEAACEAGELEAVRDCCFLSGGELVGGGFLVPFRASNEHP